MTIIQPLFRVLGTAAIVASLAACSATAPKAPAAPKLTDILAQASQAEKSGNTDAAVALWKQATVAYPADRTAWGAIAKTRFDAGKYPDAIVAAQEVLNRDANDKAAHSIMAISGVRLATKSVGELSRMNGFSGTLRTESEQLAATLKASLGIEETKVIFPPEKPPTRPPVRNPNPSGNKGKKAEVKSSGGLDDVLNGK